VNYPNRWESLRGQNFFFFVTQCYIHSGDLSLVAYIGEKMIEQFELGVINWYDLRIRTLDNSTRAYKSVQNLGWKKSGEGWKSQGILLQKIVGHPAAQTPKPGSTITPHHSAPSL